MAYFVLILVGVHWSPLDFLKATGHGLGHSFGWQSLHLFPRRFNIIVLLNFYFPFTSFLLFLLPSLSSMSDPNTPALNATGTLKDASEIDWVHSPSAEDPPMASK